jgi:hypothetical protein
VAHDAVVLMVRAGVEQLTPAAITAVQAAAGPVRNASVTRFLAGPHGLRLAEYNSVAHLDGVTAGTEGSADRAG